MNISEKHSATNGFKKWSRAHAIASNDDDKPGGATPIALAEPVRQAGEVRYSAVGSSLS
jgi:hypothetical protein